LEFREKKLQFIIVAVLFLKNPIKVDDALWLQAVRQCVVCEGRDSGGLLELHTQFLVLSISD
jgi:hypothetical protein